APVTGNTNNVSGSIRRVIRLKHRTGKNRADSALTLNILNQQWSTRVVRDAKCINFRRLRQSPRGDVRIIGRATNSAKRRQVVIVRTGSLLGRGISQSVKTSTRGSLKA